MSTATKVVVRKSFAYYRNGHQSGDQTLIVQGETRPVFKARIGAKLKLECVSRTYLSERHRLTSRDKKRFVTITGEDLKRMLKNGVLQKMPTRGHW